MGQKGEETQVLLPYTPPYQWQKIIDFLTLRAIPGVEAVGQGAYWRAVRMSWGAEVESPASEASVQAAAGEAQAQGNGQALGWLRVRPAEGENALELTVSPSLAFMLHQVASRVRHQFDLDCDPVAVSAGLEDFKNVCPGRFVEGLRLPGCFDSYEMCCRAILGQQISVKGASTLAGRMARAAGTELNWEDGGLRDDASVYAQAQQAGITHAFPGPAEVVALGEGAADALGSLGIIGRRVKTMCALAASLHHGTLSLSYGDDPAVTVPTLEALPGIGPWTAQYIAMRATGFADAFPSTDLGVKKGLAPRTVKEIEEASLAWRPWRAYATLALWTSHAAE